MFFRILLNVGSEGLDLFTQVRTCKTTSSKLSAMTLVVYYLCSGQARINRAELAYYSPSSRRHGSPRLRPACAWLSIGKRRR